ncbi:hypothetical protein SEA_MUSETTA_30 [Microbacterium phage Musetta]|nr:hypothetical protein SEA_FORK_26 [Microbacterium phage Fork]AXH50186.1 hypothetical protein SEA_MUSETTA_30 [Microbacterium phage Musetta]QYC54149.1 hypothetical protein SEA_WELCOME_31 [Microbacterium phage Welcome]UVK62444.1 hypothetical protein SEA_YUMA_29 [Microbacterium phage Yuma]
MAAREEQETIVTMGRVADYMSIWSNNVVHVRALEKEARAKRVGLEGVSDDDLSAYLEAGFGVEYHVAAEDARILNVFGRKVKPKTEEEKKAIAARLAAGRS